MTATLLIGTGADVNKILLNGTTSLHFTAQSGNKFIGRALLEAQAGINVQNENGETPLIMVAQAGNNEFVSLLCEYHASKNT